MENDVRPVDANELLKQAVYCREENGAGSAVNLLETGA